MRSMLLAVLFALWGAAAHAQVPTLVDFATVSMSAPGVPRTVTNTVCATDGTDLVCDRGVYVTSDSRVGIRTNNPSTSIHLNAASESDGIMFSNGSEPQFWLMGKRPGNYSAGPAPHLLYYAFFNGSDWVQPLNLHSDGTVGIRRSNPSTTLDVAGSLRLWQEASTTLGVCDSNRTGAIRFTGGDFSFCRNGSAWETLTSLGGGGGLSDRIVSGTSAVVVNSATGIVSISQLGAVASYVHPSLGYVGPGVSATGQISATRVYAGSSVKLANTGDNCATADDYGRMFRNPATGRLQLCMPRN